MGKAEFKADTPPIIDLGIVERTEKKRAEESRQELETLAEHPIDVPVGATVIRVKPFTLDKVIFFQDLYFDTVGKLQNSLKEISVLDGEDIGQIIVRAASARKETYEAALLLGALVLEEESEDKDFDLKNLTHPPATLRKKMTPLQLGFCIGVGLELCRADVLQKKILGVSG